MNKWMIWGKTPYFWKHPYLISKIQINQVSSPIKSSLITSNIKFHHQSQNEGPRVGGHLSDVGKFMQNFPSPTHTMNQNRFDRHITFQLFDHFFAGKKQKLPETNSWHLKIDGWKTILSFWDCLFLGAMLTLIRNAFKQNKHQHDSRKSITRCLLADFRDRVLQASALDDTQNSLNTKTEGNSLGIIFFKGPPNERDGSSSH